MARGTTGWYVKTTKGLVSLVQSSTCSCCDVFVTCFAADRGCLESNVLMS